MGTAQEARTLARLRCHDEGKDKLRKGDKPSSHFGGAYLMRWFCVNLGRLLKSLIAVRSIDFASTYRVRLRLSIFTRLASKSF